MRGLISVVLCAVAAGSGCSQDWQGEAMPAAGVDGVRLLSMTALEREPESGGTQMRAYVQIQDEFTAEWLRFELYEFMPLNANPRGKRIMLWPTVEPGRAETANPRWRPHLEAFEYVLPVGRRLRMDTAYLAEVTAADADGTRKNGSIKLKPRQR